MESNPPKKQKPAFFVLRAVIAFVLLGVLIAGLYLAAFRAWPDVAEWEAGSDRAALIYKGDTYELVGTWGEGRLTKKTYPIDKMLGEVKDSEETAATVEETVPETEETLPEETFPEEIFPEEDETLAPPPPDGTPTVPHEHTYILYSVEDKEDYLLVLWEDGEYYVYRLVEESETTD
jgi:hypothetical protein